MIFVATFSLFCDISLFITLWTSGILVRDIFCDFMLNVRDNDREHHKNVIPENLIKPWKNISSFKLTR